MPEISIIIATHNRPRLLTRAVESARRAGAEVEIIVVDDASSDDTARVCRSLSGIKYIRAERNQGVAGARNIGLVASRGEFVNFLDDDDTRLAGLIDKQIAVLRANSKAGLIYGQAIFGDREGLPLGRWYPAECPQEDLFWKLMTQNFIPCGSAVFRRSCLAKVGLLDDRIPGLDDWDLWVRIAEIYPIVALETPVIIWRQSSPASNQGTSDAVRMVTLSVRQFQEWMKLPRAASVSRQKKRDLWRNFSQNMAEHLLFESVRAWQSGNVRQSAINLSLMFKLHPLTLARIARKRSSQLKNIFRTAR